MLMQWERKKVQEGKKVKRAKESYNKKTVMVISYMIYREQKFLDRLSQINIKSEHQASSHSKPKTCDSNF